MPSTLHLPRTRVAFAAFACLAGLLAGCGTANETSDSSTSTSASGSDSGSAGTADQKYDAWEAKFRSCLSEAGFELPKEAGKIDFGDRQDAYKVAEDACLKKIGKPPTADDGPKLTDKEVQSLNLERTRCLRDRGYKVDDPKPGTAMVVPEDVKQGDLDECFKP
ncbi:hypothetical protein AB0M44_23545 [Streptosporangium subroseum]|uniref:hypothetical protein n=1 Tax=Streptosporangium subroseum TaxID=106412 RepID=UPI003436B2BA